MFTITLRLEPTDAAILETVLLRIGAQDTNRGKLFRNIDLVERGEILISVAEQIREQRWQNVNRMCDRSLADIPFPEVTRLPTYTEVLNGLVKMLQGRTVASDEHNDWSDELRRQADWLDELHQGGE